MAIRIAYTNISCGVLQISGLGSGGTEGTPSYGSPAAAIQDLMDWIDGKGNEGRGPRAKYPFVLFSDAVMWRRGQTLAAFIRENSLGKVVETSEERNPNSGRMIKVWVWSPDYGALLKWKPKELVK